MGSSNYSQANGNVQNIVILGGGTAGWITAGVLAASIKQQKLPYTVTITLVESPAIPIAGVGEGTWPSMRRTLKLMGVEENDFITHCGATFKQGAKFSGWVNGAKRDSYYHPLVLPHQYDTVNLAHAYAHVQPNESFANITCSQAPVCDLNLAPKNMSHTSFQGHLNYAYHLDASRFATYIANHCTTKLNVKHVVAEVALVEEHTTGELAGNIKSLLTECRQRIQGDLFIDCSGFKAALIGKHYQVPYVSCKDTLFCDRAAAVHLPYPNAEKPTILPYTLSTATGAGWIWDINLPHRRGAGHVFSTDHMSDEEAINQLSRYAGRPIDKNKVRFFSITPGHRAHFWHKNCVAVGLSAGFLEPLEASSLVLVEMSAHFIAQQLPRHHKVMDIVASRFNNTFTYRWSQIIDFLKLHYVLSERNEPFWQQHRKPESIPATLAEQLALWRYHTPWHHDFDHAQEVFPSASYQYVLYGMQPNYTKTFQGESVNDADTHFYQAQLEASSKRVKMQVKQCQQQLYDQATFLANLHQQRVTA